MSDINLLPSNLGPKKSAIKLARRLKTLVYISLTLEIVVMVGIIGVIVYLSQQVSDVNKRNESFKQSIVALEKTEQQLFLVKDRVSKIQSIYGQPSAYNSLDLFKITQENLPDGISFKSVEIFSDSIEFAVTSQTSKELRDFENFLKISPDITSAQMSNFAFNNETGYSATFTITGKND